MGGWIFYLVMNMLRNGIEARTPPGLASSDAFQAEPRSLENAEMGEGVNSVS